MRNLSLLASPVCLLITTTRLYGELELVDPLVNSLQDDEDLASRLQILEQLDNGPVIKSIPKAYKDDVYKLRRDIDLVRRRLGADTRP